MGRHTPPHPGRSIKRDCLDALGLTVTDGAKILGITRHMLSRIVNGQSGISPEMAVRLEKALGGTAQSGSRFSRHMTWLRSSSEASTFTRQL